MSNLRLFKVEHVSQTTGELVERYYLAKSLTEIDEAITDITEIYPLDYEVLGDSDD